MVIEERIVDADDLWRIIFKDGAVIAGLSGAGRRDDCIIGSANVTRIIYVEDTSIAAAALIYDVVSACAGSKRILLNERNLVEADSWRVIYTAIIEVGRHP